MFPSCGETGCNGLLMNVRLRCLSLVGVKHLSRLVGSLIFLARPFSYPMIKWSQPHRRLMISCIFLLNVRLYPLITGKYSRCVMVVLVCFCGHQLWHHFGLDHSRIFISRLVFVVVQVGCFLYFVMTHLFSLIGHVPGLGESSSSGNPAVPMSVKKTRAKRKLSDEEVWEWADAKIIGMYVELTHTPPDLTHCAAESQKTWKSAVYAHYNVSLERCSETQMLTFRFTCRFDPINHPSLKRGRLDTSQGTSNLERSRKKCQQLCGKGASSDAPMLSPPAYSRSKHRALIAARCASSKCPFNSVSDPYYVQEVQMLCPQASLPSPQTVSRDVLAMYSFGAGAVRDYFLVCLFFCWCTQTY